MEILIYFIEIITGFKSKQTLKKYKLKNILSEFLLIGR